MNEDVSPTKDGDFPASHVSELGGVKDLESSIFSMFKKTSSVSFCRSSRLVCPQEAQKFPLYPSRDYVVEASSFTENGINDKKTFGTRMSRWNLGSMVDKWVISPTYKWGILRL